MERACARFTDIFKTPPLTHGAAGWQMNVDALRLTQRLGFEYCSDGRGTHPHLPVWNAELIRCPQLPTTLPTLDELIGVGAVTDDNVAAHLLERTKEPAAAGHVFTLHAELEGMRFAPMFEQLLDGWKAQGCDALLDARALRHAPADGAAALRSARRHRRGAQRHAARPGRRIPGRRRPRAGGVNDPGSGIDSRRPMPVRIRVTQRMRLRSLRPHGNRADMIRRLTISQTYFQSQREPAMPTTKVTDFTAAATGGNDFKLSDHAGHPVVLYFYPKDNTPGCTVEGADFRDRHKQFAKLGAVIVGVSRDSLKSHEGFKAKMEFPFELISDADEALCTQFGVIKMKNMYGKKVRGIERIDLPDRAGWEARARMARRQGPRPRRRGFGRGKIPLKRLCHGLFMQAPQSAL